MGRNSLFPCCNSPTATFQSVELCSWLEAASRFFGNVFHRMQQVQHKFTCINSRSLYHFRVAEQLVRGSQTHSLQATKISCWSGLKWTATPGFQLHFFPRDTLLPSLVTAWLTTLLQTLLINLSHAAHPPSQLISSTAPSYHQAQPISLSLERER